MKKNLNFILIFTCFILMFFSCGKNVTENSVATSGQRLMMKSAPKMAVTCPFCGATTTPDASGCCEYCGGSVNA